MGSERDDVRVETVYGWRMDQPEWACRIEVVKPTRWQIVCAVLVELWFGVVLPALLFAIAWTLLTWRP